MASEYTRGEMDVNQHKRIYGGVMSTGLTGALICGLLVFYLALVFGAQTGWFIGLIVTGIAGFALGFALKQKTLYWTTLVGMGVIAFLAGIIASLFGAGA